MILKIVMFQPIIPPLRTAEDFCIYMSYPDLLIEKLLSAIYLWLHRGFYQHVHHPVHPKHHQHGVMSCLPKPTPKYLRQMNSDLQETFGIFQDWSPELINNDCVCMYTHACTVHENNATVGILSDAFFAILKPFPDWKWIKLRPHWWSFKVMLTNRVSSPLIFLTVQIWVYWR